MNRVVLKEYTQTCTIVGTDYPVKGEDPKKPFYFIFFFLPLAILIVSNTAMCIKVKVMLRDLNNTQKAENAFIGMLGITFVFWLLFVLPFIVVDTLLDSCFQKPGLHAAAYIINWTKVCCPLLIQMCMSFLASQDAQQVMSVTLSWLIADLTDVTLVSEDAFQRLD